ncbi:hypothetical protein R1sor_022034 [Riccia sorocarpa]|uniref:Reverse transcriptase zinc-binding domain-containing protein n=1 Tax=Riccia sorocarpa TaxID=122646 RepID=A0ABD3GIQ4_9MARC
MGQIFAMVFLNVDPSVLTGALLASLLPEPPKGCPFVSLMFTTWGVSGSYEALEISKRACYWLPQLEQTSIMQITELATEALQNFGEVMSEPEREVITVIKNAERMGRCFALTPSEWRTVGGQTLNMHWKALQIYWFLIHGREDSLVERLNKKWVLRWAREEWQLTWKINELKGLPLRHKVFFWRVLNRTFVDGTKVSKMGATSGSCIFCGEEREDLMHVLLCCPRWHALWYTVLRRWQGWDVIEEMVDSASPLPLVLRWVMSASQMESLLSVGAGYDMEESLGREV